MMPANNMTKIALVKNPHSTLPGALTVVEDSTVAPHIMLLRTENWEVEINAKSGKLTKRKRLKFEPLPDHGTHMTWSAFAEMVADGGIENDDGCGQYATATEMANRNISIDYITAQLPPGFVVDVDVDDEGNGHATNIPKIKPPHAWVTHVVWFNK